MCLSRLRVTLPIAHSRAAVGAHHEEVGAEVGGARQHRVADLDVVAARLDCLGAHAVARQMGGDIRAGQMAMVARVDAEDDHAPGPLEHGKGGMERPRRLAAAVPGDEHASAHHRIRSDVGHDDGRPARVEHDLLGELDEEPALGAFRRRLADDADVGVAQVEGGDVVHVALFAAPFCGDAGAFGARPEVGLDGGRGGDRRSRRALIAPTRRRGAKPRRCS